MEAVYTYKSNWRGYISKRVLYAVIMFFLISLVVYFYIHGLWGTDNAVNILSLLQSPNQMTERQRLLDKYLSNESRIVQYFQWLGGILTGDWGVSLNYSE